MNTVIRKIVDEDTEEVLGLDMDENLGDAVVRSLVRNNSFLPNIERVIYNTKTEESAAELDKDGNPVVWADGKTVRNTRPLENPILVTVVYFADGTKVTVKNSDKDAITLVDEKVKLSDGNVVTVKTASQESKEVGLVYALAKRVICMFDDGGNVQNAGFAKFLSGIVGNARVQDVEEAKLASERKIQRAKAKSSKAKSSREKTPMEKRSLGDIVTDLSRTVGKLGEVVSSIVSQKKED